MRVLHIPSVVLVAVVGAAGGSACSAEEEGTGGSGPGGAAAGASDSATSSGGTAGGDASDATASSAGGLDGPGGAGATSQGAGGTGSGGAAEGGAAGTGGGPPAEEPCPALPTPSNCFDREVMYREWGPDAVGDGTYFADQAPNRLGFSRVRDRVWIVKFQVEENTYFGRVSPYGDATGGIGWIARGPCDPAFAEESGLITWSGQGGGALDFVVVRDDADEAILDGDPAYASWAAMPRLRGGYCYYAGFENAGGLPDFPLDASSIETATDDCGASGDGTCYYLAFDFGHRLHDVTTGQLIAGNVIAGLTH